MTQSKWLDQTDWQGVYREELSVTARDIYRRAMLDPNVTHKEAQAFAIRKAKELKEKRAAS